VRHRLLTIDDLDAAGDDRRVELVAGELVEEAMTRIATEVDVGYGPNDVYRHDVTGWRKARVPRRSVGARVSVLPDWVCEVLSSNRRKDLVEKRARLHDAGVGH
jgi:Uma2 family endonuclease